MQVGGVEKLRRAQRRLVAGTVAAVLVLGAIAFRADSWTAAAVRPGRAQQKNASIVHQAVQHTTAAQSLPSLNIWIKATNILVEWGAEDEFRLQTASAIRNAPWVTVPTTNGQRQLVFSRTKRPAGFFGLRRE